MSNLLSYFAKKSGAAPPPAPLNSNAEICIQRVAAPKVPNPVGIPRKLLPGAPEKPALVGARGEVEAAMEIPELAGAE